MLGFSVALLFMIFGYAVKKAIKPGKSSAIGYATLALIIGLSGIILFAVTCTMTAFTPASLGLTVLLLLLCALMGSLFA